MRLATAAVWAATMLVALRRGRSSPSSFVDLSCRNLSSVPSALPPEVERLDLSRNHIEHLHQGDFANATQLRFLNMSWNGLEEIDPQTFLDTPHLENLDLSHNELKNLSSQAYLLHAGNLGALNLTHNGFLVMTLGSEFGALHKLKTLALGAKNISVGDFQNVAGIKLHTLSLNLEGRCIYEAGSLEDAEAQRLQIVFNGREVADDYLVADALSLFDELELMNLTGGYNELISSLSKKAEIRTSHLHLINLAANWADFTRYTSSVLQTSITHLSTTDLALYHLPYEDTDVIKASSVQSVTVRRAMVMSFFFSQEAVYNFFINLPVEESAILETGIIHMTCPKSQSPTRRLDFSYCALSDTIFSSVEGEEINECRNLGNMSALILAGNNLKNFQLLSKRLQYMDSLQHLDLSVNTLVYNGMEECVWPPNIISMTLATNSLTDLVFRCLPKGIEVLDLENNQISAVPAVIHKLDQLVSLNLNANRLRDLPVCDGFPMLGELLLRSNSLHAPSVSKLKSCPRLGVMDVSENPFTCTCALRGFISLGIKFEKSRSQAGTVLLRWPSEYYCTYPEDVRNTSLRDTWIPEVSCSVSLLAAAILCPAIVVIIAVLSLCHCLDIPWYMRMIWQWTRAKHRARMRQVRPEDLLGIEFHAFVSYSQHDANWVHNSLLPNLEGPAGGLRICHHETNFVPGKTIIENIVNCVERSRRSVFVLSAHFVKSDWCHYELYFASHQRLSHGSDSIVLVLLEPLPQYLIPTKYYQLKSMMRRHTYLEWPQDKAKHRLFWANLRAALQADLPTAPSTELEE